MFSSPNGIPAIKEKNIHLAREKRRTDLFFFIAKWKFIRITCSVYKSLVSFCVCPLIEQAGISLGRPRNLGKGQKCVLLFQRRFKKASIVTKEIPKVVQIKEINSTAIQNVFPWEQRNFTRTLTTLEIYLSTLFIIFKYILD